MNEETNIFDCIPSVNCTRRAASHGARLPAGTSEVLALWPRPCYEVAQAINHPAVWSDIDPTNPARRRQRACRTETSRGAEPMRHTISCPTYHPCNSSAVS